MARWEPGSSERLQQAALDLFHEQGFEQTTVAEIAARAGVTERTFFRYYSDKREALFAGGSALEALFVDAVAVSTSDHPLDQVTKALSRAGEFFTEERRTWSRKRAVVVASTTALTERELLKMGSLGRALAAALRTRGLDEPAASLLAQSAITVFQVAFERWVAAGEARPYPELQQDTLVVLRQTLGA